MASVDSGNHQSQVQKLSGSEDYFNWKFDMEMLLIGKDLWDIVQGTEVLDKNNKDRENIDNYLQWMRQ